MLLLLADKVRSLQGMTLQGRPAQPGAGSAISHLAIKPATERARLLVGNGTAVWGCLPLYAGSGSPYRGGCLNVLGKEHSPPKHADARDLLVLASPFTGIIRTYLSIPSRRGRVEDT